MTLFRPTTDRQLATGLTLLRVITGIIFAAHGAQKLFVFGLDGVAGGFAQMGIPFAAVVGPAVGLLEFFGGIALAVGLLTRLVGLGLAVNMLGALTLVHLKAGFFLPNGYEFVLALFASAATLAITGAGRLSLDNLIAARPKPVTSERPALRRAA